MKWNEGEVVENRQWNDRLFSLRIKAPAIEFKPGQFIRVGLEIDGEVLARPYSLVNSPDDECLEIFFNIVPEGPLSPLLAKLSVGDKLKVAPKTAGFLVVDEVPEVKNLWLLATGTAIGPFLSILKTEAPYRRFEKIILCYSVSTQDELSYMETIEQLLDAHKEKLAFVPFVTREEMDGAIQTRIPLSITNGELEKRVGVVMDESNSHVMICGSSAMMKDASEALGERGLRKHLRREPGHISTEKYH